MTDRKGAIILQPEEDIFRTLSNISPIGIFIVQDGMLQFGNPQFQRDTGYSESELIGKKAMDLVYEEDRQFVRDTAVAMLKAQSSLPYEYRAINKRNEIRWVLGTIASIQYKGKRAAVGYFMDVTVRYEAERELHRTHQRVKEELKAAARIQQSLLPPNSMEVAGVGFEWAFRPCEELAGDTLNVFPFDDERIGLYVLDVSGHGLVAALLSVTLSRALYPNTAQSIVARYGSGGSSHLVRPSQVAEELNRQFPMDDTLLQYFTLQYGTLNVKTRNLRYVSAGHPGPLYFPHNGQAQLLKSPGFPVGLFKEVRYQDYSLKLNPGDRLCLFSDGITDAVDSLGEQFGEQRLLRAFSESRGFSLQESVAHLLEIVTSWHGGTKLVDDISLVALEIRD